MKRTASFILLVVSASGAAQTPVVVKKDVVYGNVHAGSPGRYCHPGKNSLPAFGTAGAGSSHRADPGEGHRRKPVGPASSFAMSID